MRRRPCEAAARRDEVPGRCRPAAGQITVPRNQWAYRHVTPTPRGPESQPCPAVQSRSHAPRSRVAAGASRSPTEGRPWRTKTRPSLPAGGSPLQAGRPLAPADPAKYLVWTRRFWIWCHQMVKFRCRLMSKLLRVLSCFQTE